MVPETEPWLVKTLTLPVQVHCCQIKTSDLVICIHALFVAGGCVHARCGGLVQGRTQTMA